MGHRKGAYWYGSQLTLDDARSLCPHNSATSLQVAAGVLAGCIWAIRHPERGAVTLANNLARYAWHSRHHTAHITRLRERMGW